jgi:hypothetical protein
MQYSMMIFVVDRNSKNISFFTEGSSYMKKSEHIAAWTLLFLIMASKSFLIGQTPLSDAEKKEYFDDAKISVSRNTLKIDLPSFIQKELSLYFEHKYADKLSLEVAVGYLFPGYHHSVYSALFYNPDEQGSGFSTFLQQRFYTTTGFNPYYIQFSVKHRQFATMSSGDLMLGFGQKWLLGDRIWFDLSLGMGLRKKWRKSNDPYGYQEWDDFMLGIPIIMKVGYILK